MIDIDAITTNLEQDERGVWMPKGRSSVSYPEDGNARSRRLEEESFWFNHRNACIVAAAKTFPPDGTVFDIGGGNGYVSLALLRADCAAVLVEPGLEGVENARVRGVAPIIAAALDDTGFRPGSLPAAGLFDVIEHIEDDATFLRSVHDAMTTGGRLYVTAPAYSFLWSNEDRRAGHYRRYTAAGLARRLDGAGFDTEFATYIFEFLPAPIFLLRTVPTHLRIRRTSEFQRIQREHRSAGGLVSRLQQWSFRRELEAIRAKRALPFGGSCLVIARAR
ncbi:MAG TPA: methyltransferase domain-containing protein [Candidatus Hydrogenedentes bacterium]|mgnify:CR=1 FL=1|nr:methyltransferase domain-containing protein [Candidatus Hydrogenedentota bacterium]